MSSDKVSPKIEMEFTTVIIDAVQTPKAESLAGVKALPTEMMLLEKSMSPLGARTLAPTMRMLARTTEGQRCTHDTAPYLVCQLSWVRKCGTLGLFDMG